MIIASLTDRQLHALLDALDQYVTNTDEAEEIEGITAGDKALLEEARSMLRAIETAIAARAHDPSHVWQPPS